MTDERHRRDRADEPRPEDRPDDELGDRERVPIRVRDKRILSSEDQPPAESEAEGEVMEAEAGGTGSGAGATQDPDRRLTEAKQLAEDRLDQLKRLKADFENYKKRMIREQTELVDRASQRIVERLLPVLDDLERALDAARDHEGIAKGVELVRKQLLDVLASEGLEHVEARGEAFDPVHHEAVHSEPGGVDEPTVLEVVRPGYRLKGRTIRPALVHVATPGSQEDAEEGDG